MQHHKTIIGVVMGQNVIGNALPVSAGVMFEESISGVYSWISYSGISARWNSGMPARQLAIKPGTGI